jgi:ubiquinone/menaquinone biosynthesis C-methylase UbiE
MAEGLSYRAEAAAEYDRAFSHVSSYFLPFLLRAARLAPDQRVLDIAAGTGIATEAALSIIGPEGSIVAADLSPEMVERAEQRLLTAPNASVAVENGQNLSFPDQSFDAVLCSLGLMFFPDPARGLSARLAGRDELLGKIVAFECDLEEEAQCSGADVGGSHRRPDRGQP